MFNFTIENSTHDTASWKYGKQYWTSFELYPDWTGTRFYTFKGAAYHGNDYWSQAMVVVKTFRHHNATHEDWMLYRRRCEEARKMAKMFNKLMETYQCPTKITFIRPTVAKMNKISDVMTITRPLMRFNKRFGDDEVVLIEDLLEGNIKTFVTSTGETTTHGTQYLDAFCHYTYHASNQKYVVCNLHGVEDEDEPDQFKFTEPVVHSANGTFGSSDKSVTGIRDFFKNHVCSYLCKDFSKPSDMTFPSAPNQNECTSSKVSEYYSSCRSELCQLPAYKVKDSNAPPPYDVQ